MHSPDFTRSLLASASLAAFIVAAPAMAAGITDHIRSMAELVREAAI